MCFDFGSKKKLKIFLVVFVLQSKGLRGFESLLCFVLVPRNFLGRETGETRDVKMISDTQLAMLSNMLGITLFLLVVLYHFIAANSHSRVK